MGAGHSGQSAREIFKQLDKGTSDGVSAQPCVLPTHTQLDGNGEGALESEQCKRIEKFADLLQFDASKDGVFKLNEFRTMMRHLQRLREQKEMEQKDKPTLGQTVRKLLSRREERQESPSVVWKSLDLQSAALLDLDREAATPAIIRHQNKEHHATVVTSPPVMRKSGEASSSTEEHESLDYLSRSLSAIEGREEFKSWLFRLADFDHSQCVTLDQLRLILKAVSTDHIKTSDLMFDDNEENPFAVQQIMDEYDTGKTGFLTHDEFMVLADLIVRNYERHVEAESETLSQTHTIGPYRLQWKLGEGASGEVYLAEQVETGDKKAIKIIPFERVKELSRLDVEVKAMLMLKHENIVQLEEVLEDDKRVYLIMELCGGGSLADYVDIKPLSEELARFYFKQMMNAVSYCHNRGVVHRDLKLENLLLDNEGVIHISDFGQAGIFREGWDMFSTAVGSLYHLSPEQVEGRCYSGEKMDMWAIGIALYRMIVGKPPFFSPQIHQMLEDIKAVKYKCPSTVSRYAADLIGRLLIYDPDDRWDFDQLALHPWLSGLTTHPQLEVQSIRCKNTAFDKERLVEIAKRLNNVCVCGPQEIKCHYPKKDLKFRISFSLSASATTSEGEQQSTAQMVEIEFRLRKGQALAFKEMVDAIVEQFQSNKFTPVRTPARVQINASPSHGIRSSSDA